MDMVLLKTRVKGTAKFAFFRDGELWYATDDGWVFPIAVAETTNAQGASPTFNRDEKAIYLMRWIRRYMEAEAQWRVEAQR